MHRIMLPLALLALLLSYQNCSPYEPSQQTNSSSVGGSADQSPQIADGNSNEDGGGDEDDKPLEGNMVPVFLAVGHMARSLISCDGGQSWIKDRSDDDNARCWVTDDPNYVECDHTPQSSVGLDYGDGWFFATFGWGKAGTLRRSQDGVHWEVINSGSWGKGAVYADGGLFLPWGSGSVSRDLGETWQQTEPRTYKFDYPLPKRLGSTFYMFGRNNDAIGISDDQGETWEISETFRHRWSGGLAEGKGIIVAVGQQQIEDPNNAGEMINVGLAAKSLDGGRTWAETEVFRGKHLEWNGFLFNGTNFIGYSRGKAWRSSDGSNWTSQEVVIDGSLPPFLLRGPFSYSSETGTYVAILSLWARFYEKQKALRSDDGINWTELAPDKFKGGHPIQYIKKGYLDSSFCR